jgi:hypothetical protein
MNRLTKTLLCLTFLLGACTQGISSPTTPPQTMDISPQPPSSLTECGFQWASNDLPDLTSQFDQAVKNLVPNSTSRTSAFGENCVASDGQVVRFLPMETDFYTVVNVKDLNDHETFGNWIAGVMNIVNGFPSAMLTGPKSGFVEFRFDKNTTESIVLRVPIQQYNETANGITGEELFRMFYPMP